jgi:hypothetical protein
MPPDRQTHDEMAGLDSRGLKNFTLVFSSTIRRAVYQLNKTATNLLIQDLCNAVSVYAFVMHQRVKLALQQRPLIGNRLSHKLSNEHTE